MAWEALGPQETHLPGWIDFEAPRLLYATRGKNQLTYPQRRWLVLLVAGSDRSWPTQQVCPGCEMDDSVSHRLWICSYTDHVRRLKETPGKWCPPNMHTR